MLNNGVPVLLASRRLGHARPSITLDVYGHLIPSMQVETAEMMDRLITPIRVEAVAPGCTSDETLISSETTISPTNRSK
jgi:hypothetical protein